MRRLQSAVSLNASPAVPSTGVDEIVRSGSRQSLLPYRQVPIDWIETDSNQPRQHFDPEKLKHLTEDIRRHGIDTPLSVRSVGPERFLLLAGERRLRAARMAGLATVPIFVRDELTPKEADLLRLRENLQREGLTPLEEARGLRLYKESTRKTWEEVGREFGWKKPTVLEKVRLLDAPEQIQTMIEEQRIAPSHYMALAALPEDQQLRIATLAASEGLSTQDVRRMKSQAAESQASATDAPDEEPPSDAIDGLGTQTPQDTEKYSTNSAEVEESMGTQTPQPALSKGTERRMAGGAGRAEIRFYTTPEYQCQLRHIAADLAGGSLAQLSRTLVEWFADQIAAGHSAPWLVEKNGK